MRKLIVPLVLLVVASVVLAVTLYYFAPWMRMSASIEPPPINAPRPPEAAAGLPAVPFVDVTDRAGIKFRHTNGATPGKLLPETMGSGVAVFDFDGDGKQDLLFVNSCEWPGTTQGARPTPALYRNKGDGAFEDVTAGSGLDVVLFGMGVAVGDFDNDGRPDVYLSGVGDQRLFRNEDGKHFRDVTVAAGLGGDHLPDCPREEFLKWAPPIPFGSSATFLDYDGDARLDLFICRYVTWSPKIDKDISATLRGGSRTYLQPKEFDGGWCVLYRNKGDGIFEDVSEAAGVRVAEAEGVGPKARQRPVAKALGVIACDPDEDGWPDLVVANDTVRNFYFQNVAGPDGTRRFEEKGYETATAYPEDGRPRGGMGIDWGEFRPGKSAIVIANFANEANTFLSLDRRKPLLFSDAALAVGLAGPSRTPLKFGTFFFDCDLDGRLDLLSCNGHIDPDITSIQAAQTYAQPAQMFCNTGVPEKRQFEPFTAKQSGDDLFKPMVGRGSAFGDLDGDGDLDVVLTANGGPARVLRNDSKTGNRWVRLVLKGDGKRSNASAIGAQLTIEAGGKTMKRQVTGGRGYLSQSELPITVGLGKAEKVDRVTVRWPGSQADAPEVWQDLRAEQTHELRQGAQ